MRIRTVKPEFYLHEGLYDLERETGLPIRLAFSGLWCAADREGRFRWEPRKLKAQILPYDEVEFSRVLDALTTRGFLVRYASGASEFGWIPSFKRHQFVNPREAHSELPNPPDSSQITETESVDAWTTRDSRVTDACPTRLSCSLPNTVPFPKGESEGKPDHYHKDSRTVLHVLNEACGAHYREVDSNLSVISERLREPEVTLDGVRQMIDRQCKRWKGTPQAEYLRPETLFAKSKFDSYYANRELPVHADNGKAGQKGADRNSGTLNDPSRYNLKEIEKRRAIQAKEQLPSQEPGAPASI